MPGQTARLKGHQRAAFAVVWVMAVSTAFAQETGVIRGRITDDSGSALVGATVTLRSKSNPSVNSLGQVTNARGEYRFTAIPPGNDYKVTASFPGYGIWTQGPVSVNSGRATSLNFILREELVEHIDVEAEGDIVDTEKTTTSTVVSQEYLTGLPIRGRNYTEVLTLAPGVTDIDGDGNPNVKGAREVDFQMRLDNVPIDNPVTSQRVFDLNIESFEEIQVITGALTAEYSSQGGLGLVTTRSGGNEFRGSFKIFYQSSSIDSDGANNRDVTNDVRDIPSFRTLRPFLTAGGAFKKDRLWYFAALEYIDEQTPVIFSAASRIRGKEGHRDFAKLTWQANPAHKASLEFYYEPTDTFGNFIGPTIADETDFQTEDIGRIFSVRETWVITPTVLLESHISFTTLDLDIRPVLEPDLSITDDINEYGNPQKRDEQMLDFVVRTGLSVNPFDEHYLFDLTNQSVRGPYFITQMWDVEQFQIREDFSFYVDDFFGTHTLKTGVEWLDQDYNDSTTRRPTVSRNLVRGSPPVLNFQAPVLAGRELTGADRYNIGFYVQDTWKPFPNLAVRFGVRVDREVVGSEGRTPFDPSKELDEYNRVANLYYLDPSPVKNDPNATGQFVVPLSRVLNFAINPLTETFFCDLDGDGTCNGQTDPDGALDPGVHFNSDGAILKSIFSRSNFDCTLNSHWGADPGAFSGAGIACPGSAPGDLREGRDIEPEQFSIGNTNVAPRFSISYDPFKDGKTKLYATWGRVYDALFLGTVVAEQRRDIQSFTFVQRGQNDPILTDVVEGGFSIYQVDRDLRTPYTDEWTVGFERELAPELAVKVIYTDRKGRNQLQDIDINHTTVDRRGATVDSGSDGFFDDCVDGFNTVSPTCTPDG